MAETMTGASSITAFIVLNVLLVMMTLYCQNPTRNHQQAC